MSGKKLLIIEDEGILAMNMEISLENMGYEVVGSFFSAESAMDFLEGDRPHLIMMDITLRGELDGIEAARMIQERYVIPIIFITGNADEKTKERAMSIKPAGYIKKPINDSTMQHAIEQALMS